jgi:hypothetical protein
MKTKLTLIGGLALALAAGPALAHHSGAMFDSKKSVTLTGTIKSFEWTNPHSWMEVMVPGKGGALTQWSIELNGPESLFRQGFRPNMPKAGDKVTVVAHPLKDGRHGGSVMSVTLPNGKFIGIPST